MEKQLPQYEHVKEPNVKDVLSARMLLENTVLKVESFTLKKMRKRLNETVFEYPSLKKWLGEFCNRKEKGLKELEGIVSVVYVTYSNSS